MNLDKPLSRSDYFRMGLGLMLLKYSVEIVLHYVCTQSFLTPLQFLFPSLGLRSGNVKSQYATFYLCFLIFWSLPFLYLGLTLSVRRAIDAGFSPWFGLGFLIPLWNYVVMFSLSVAKTSEPEGLTKLYRKLDLSKTTTILLSLGFSLLLTLPPILISVFINQNYGSLLFIGIPSMIGAVSGYIWNIDDEKSFSSTLGMTFSTLLFIGSSLSLFAVEGFICIIMAVPFAMLGGILGAVIGRHIAKIKRTLRSDLTWIIVPLLVGLLNEHFLPEENLRRVTTEVTINSTPEKIWQNVIAFPQLPTPTEAIFNLGIAYPTHAEIQGSGVGAIRYCYFSTGAFVEPITIWEPPLHLAFDVKEQPLPMKETSIWGEIHPPHLYTSFRSSKGEFRLIANPDKTFTLQGNTYYNLKMGPEVYWGFLADQIVHTIHYRVLNHIKNISEKE